MSAIYRTHTLHLNLALSFKCIAVAEAKVKLLEVKREPVMTSMYSYTVHDRQL
jgi:hypothetical protein